MTAADGQSRISRKERIARAAVGMPANHLELITRKPSRAEWNELAARLAELWPHDEYTVIVAEEGWQGRPPPGPHGQREDEA
jgi:hypothetical protein